MPVSTKRFYLIALAGLAGGLAEIFWIGVYSTMTQVGGLEISRQITATLIPEWAGLLIAPVLGVAIHLVLSVILAFICCSVFIEPLARRFGHTWILPGSVFLLASVWLINFMVLLPVINPAFVTLMPFLITLASKMLFGWAMGSVLLKCYGSTADHSAN